MTSEVLCRPPDVNHSSLARVVRLHFNQKNSPQYVFPNTSHTCHYRRYRTYRKRVERVRESFTRSPKKSVRKASRELAIPATSVWRILWRRI
ncbi:hypothetical protein ANN_24233 [Periplaneta americana]|uniref:Uncharacterized protein n=1 Tax=Periplaneta americana TaxID=6978 RepID=A0ABQ8S2J4_PERAM|nr:hypothetical protein ANN_24233 [Periplaneta americana]